MSEHPNVATMRRAYADFAAGNLPAVLDLFAPDALFHVGGEGPTSGDHKGHAAIAEALKTGAVNTGGTQRFDIRGIYVDDRHAVVVTRRPQPAPPTARPWTSRKCTCSRSAPTGGSSTSGTSPPTPTSTTRSSTVADPAAPLERKQSLTVQRTPRGR